MIKKLSLLNKSLIPNKPKTKDLKEQENHHRNMNHKQTLKSKFVKIEPLKLKIQMKKSLKNIQAKKFLLKRSKSKPVHREIKRNIKSKSNQLRL